MSHSRLEKNINKTKTNKQKKTISDLFRCTKHAIVRLKYKALEDSSGKLDSLPVKSDDIKKIYI